MTDNETPKPQNPDPSARTHEELLRNIRKLTRTAEEALEENKQLKANEKRYRANLQSRESDAEEAQPPLLRALLGSAQGDREMHLAAIQDLANLGLFATAFSNLVGLFWDAAAQAAGSPETAIANVRAHLHQLTEGEPQ